MGEFKPYLYSTDDLLQLICQLSVFLTMFSALIIKTRVNKEEAMRGAGLTGILVFLQAAPILLGGTAAVLKLVQHAQKQGGKIKRKKKSNQKVVPAVDDAPSDEVTDMVTDMVKQD